MKKRLFPALVFVSGLSLSLLAASSYFPEFYHLYNPKAGHWSKYDMTDSRKEKATLTFAVVGSEGADTWLEVTSTGEGGSGTVAYLVSGDPTDDANVVAIRVREPDGPLLEISRATLEKLKARGQQAFGKPALPIGPTVGKIQALPDETLQVGGHSLKCQHIKVVGAGGQSAEAWINEEIVPFGLVKLVSGEESVVLLDYGKGAKPSLTGQASQVTVE